MAGFFLGGEFFAVNSLFMALGLQPSVVYIALFCAVLGTLVLSRFTLSLGVLTYPVNFVALLAGAIVANILMKEFRLPFDPTFERPVMISIGGMAVTSIITLIFLSRDLRG